MLDVQRGTSGDMFRLSFETRLHGPCMRCLRDAVVDVAVDAREYHDHAEDAADELRTEYVVETSPSSRSGRATRSRRSLPEQILCRDDCAGLCPVCGKDLNDEPHVHEETQLDPRWSALEALREE